MQIRGEDSSVIDRVDLIRDVEEMKEYPPIGAIRMDSWNGLNTAQIRQTIMKRKTTRRRFKLMLDRVFVNLYL